LPQRKKAGFRGDAESQRKKAVSRRDAESQRKKAVSRRDAESQRKKAVSRRDAESQRKKAVSRRDAESQRKKAVSRRDAEKEGGSRRGAEIQRYRVLICLFVSASPRLCGTYLLSTQSQTTLPEFPRNRNGNAHYESAQN